MTKRIKLSVDIPEDWQDYKLLYVMLVKKDEDGKLIDALKVGVKIESIEEINDDDRGQDDGVTWREHMGR